MTGNRNYSLDILKIIGSVIIVLHHYQQQTGEVFERLNFYNGGFNYGLVVELFFILSGFFSLTYVEKIRSGCTDLQTFYSRKMVRLLPAAAASAVAYEILLFVYNHMAASPYNGYPVKLWGTLITCLGIQDWGVFGNPMVNNPLWYISVLLLCYILFYILCRAAGRLKIPAEYLFLLAVFCGYSIQKYGVSLPFFNYDTSRGIYPFFTGLLLARIEAKGLVREWHRITVLILSVLWIMAYRYRNYLIADDLMPMLVFVLYPALIIGLQASVFRRIFDHPWIGKLGEISFGVYVWHNVLLIPLYILKDGFGLPIETGSYAVMFGFLLLSFAAGAASYYLIEVPIRRKLAIKKVHTQQTGA